MKKIFTRVLAGLMAITALAMCCACGSKTTSKKEDVPTLLWYLPGSQLADLPKITAAVNEIIEPKIGAKVDIQILDNSAYEQRMTMNMAAQSEYDICFTGYTNKYNEAVSAGGLYDITDLLDEVTPELKKAIPEYAWESLKVDGRIYGVPNQQTFCQTVGILFRKDLVEKYGFDIESVKTISDLEPFLKLIKENEPDYIPLSLLKHHYVTNDLYEEIKAFSSMIYMKRDGSHKVVAVSEIPEIREFAEQQREWFKKGYLRADVATVKNNSGDIYRGKYACWPIAWKPGVIQEEQLKMPDVEIVGVNVTVPYMTRNLATATNAGISCNSKNPEKALKFIELLNTDKELYNLICWGLEGEHYEKISDTHIKLIPNSAYNPNAAWKYGCVFNSFLLEGQPDALWEETLEENETCERSDLLGLAFDITPVRTELANCSAIYSEYSGRVANGTAEPESFFDEYQKRMKGAGIDKVVKEAQRQIDEYLKNK